MSGCSGGVYPCVLGYTPTIFYVLLHCRKIYHTVPHYYVPHYCNERQPCKYVLPNWAEKLNPLLFQIFRKSIRQPRWPGGLEGHEHAPPDVPPCGFAGELCDDEGGECSLLFIIDSHNGPKSGHIYHSSLNEATPNTVIEFEHYDPMDFWQLQATLTKGSAMQKKVKTAIT